MNKLIIITFIFSLFCSLNINAQSKYPDPPENNSKEVMDKYQKAVDQWYMENPKKDEEEINSEVKTNVEETIQGPNLTSDDIPKTAIVWKLSKIEIIENGVIDEQLNEFQENFVNRFTSKKLRIYIDQNKYFYVQEEQNIVKKYAVNINADKMSLQEYNCPKCETHVIDVINYDANSMITEKEAVDDKENKFTIRFSYDRL